MMNTSTEKRLSVLLVDPSLFTAPYDAALTDGLIFNGVSTRWAARPLRSGEEGILPDDLVEPLFYRGLQDTVRGKGAVRKLRKGVSHLLGGLRLLKLLRQEGFDVIHVQWTVMPVFDAWFMGRAARRVPVVLTVHDSRPFNGSPTSRLQMVGFDRALRSASRIIVHTSSARLALIERGYPPRQIKIIPHGAIKLKNDGGRSPRPAAQSPAKPWTFVLFGKLQPYKGLDVLIEAVGRIPPERRTGLRFVVAGEPMMALEPLVDRVAQLHLEPQLQFRAWRHTEDEMAELFAEADTFVFPYKQIEASGVLFLVQQLGKWMVASDLGSFSEMIVQERTGLLVAPQDADALARAMMDSVGRQPDMAQAASVPDWHEIGHQTRKLYEEAIAERTAA